MKKRQKLLAQLCEVQKIAETISNPDTNGSGASYFFFFPGLHVEKEKGKQPEKEEEMLTLYSQQLKTIQNY